jgi:hypothetical protein
MDGGWTGNTFLLRWSSLANQGDKLNDFYYIPTNNYYSKFQFSGLEKS